MRIDFINNRNVMQAKTISHQTMPIKYLLSDISLMRKQTVHLYSF